MADDPSKAPQVDRVLILEDEPLIAADIAFILRRAGYVALGPAHDVAAAHALLDAGVVDAAILDVNLGQSCDFETADRLEAEGIPFCFLTGHSRRIVEGRFADRPMLAKPFRERDLRAMVGALLRSSGAA